MREPLTREQRIECIVRTLRPTDPGSWDVNVTYVTAEFDSHDAALRQQLAARERAVWAELRTAISNGKCIPLDTSFNTKKMFEVIHWLEAYIDKQAEGVKP